MSNNSIISSGPAASDILIGNILENIHIQQSSINALADRVDKLDNTVTPDAEEPGASSINPDNVRIDESLYIRRDEYMTTTDNDKYKTKINDDLELGVGKFKGIFLRGRGGAPYQTSVNAIYYDFWGGGNLANHGRFTHPEIKLAAPTPPTTTSTSSDSEYNTFQIGPVTEADGNENNTFIVNLKKGRPYVVIGDSSGNPPIANTLLKIGTGAGVTVKELSGSSYELEVDGNIKIDGGSNPSLKFNRIPATGASHELSEIRAEQDVTNGTSGTNGGDLQFYTKDQDISGVTGTVTEKLRINNVGAIGIRGANYGTAGAVLTSNGPSAAVSWNRPYIMKAYLEYNITVDPRPPTGSNRVVDMVETDWDAPFGGATDDWLNDVWTCPQTGIYRITMQIIMVSSDDNITFALGTVSQSGTIILRSENYIGNNTTEELERVTVNATGIFKITATQTIQLDFGLITYPVSFVNTQLRGVRVADTDPASPIVGDATFLMIERVL